MRIQGKIYREAIQGYTGNISTVGHMNTGIITVVGQVTTTVSHTPI